MLVQQTRRACFWVFLLALLVTRMKDLEKAGKLTAIRDTLLNEAKQDFLSARRVYLSCPWLAGGAGWRMAGWPGLRMRMDGRRTADTTASLPRHGECPAGVWFPRSRAIFSRVNLFPALVGQRCRPRSPRRRAWTPPHSNEWPARRPRDVLRQP